MDFLETKEEYEKRENLRKKKNNSFLPGFIIGFFVACAIMLIAMLIAYAFGGFAYFGISNKSKDTAIDQATISKLRWMETMFDHYSVYDLDKDDMSRGILDGFVRGTGDRYAEYYSKEEIDELQLSYQGIFYGIGATLFINEENGYAEVSSVYEDSPAQKAGIREGDIIVTVDGVDLMGLTLDEMVSHIRGDKGSTVEIQIAREGEENLIDVKAVRDEIHMITVEYEMLDEEVGYISVITFEEVTVDQFADALATLKGNDMKALIIDLRGNSGGLLDSVCDMLRMMLPEGVIVSCEDSSGARHDIRCDGKRELKLPIVVLTNAYTASASEIMTSALRDYNMATVIGTRTYGKGVVQGFYNMADGSCLKLTINKYYTPGGYNFDGEGIEPDEVVEFDYEAYYYSDNPTDNQLDYAVDYLKNKLKGSR